MSKSNRFRIWSQTAAPLAIAAALMAGKASPVIAKGSSFDVLYTFTGGADGYSPFSSLIADQAGNLYGTTLYGGNDNVGVVFKLTPDGSESVLHSFSGGEDGSNPVSGVIEDQAGNFYGTTSGGGSDNLGVAFKLAPNGTETILHTFTGGSDGGYPYSNLIMDKKGNLYGTTVLGGADNNGVVFELASNGTEKVIYTFTGGNDGGYPFCDLLRDRAGNLYGTAPNGGANGAGVIFQLAPDGTYTVLHAFTGGGDGGNPYAGLIQDKAGNLYGTASAGGAYDYYGTVFKIAPGGTYTVLYSFTGGNDGGYPKSDLIADGAGNLYSTTYQGGADGFGVAFRLAPDGTATVLHNFTGVDDGAIPNAGLNKDKGQSGGYLYGTASVGGADGSGVVFKVKK